MIIWTLLDAGLSADRNIGGGGPTHFGAPVSDAATRGPPAAEPEDVAGIAGAGDVDRLRNVVEFPFQRVVSFPTILPNLLFDPLTSWRPGIALSRTPIMS